MGAERRNAALEIRVGEAGKKRVGAVAKLFNQRRPTGCLLVHDDSLRGCFDRRRPINGFDPLAGD